MPSYGGRRKGAGRKVGSGKYGEPTKTMRLPLSVLGMIARQFHKLEDFVFWLKAQLETNEKK